MRLWSTPQFYYFVSEARTNRHITLMKKPDHLAVWNLIRVGEDDPIVIIQFEALIGKAMLFFVSESAQ